MKTKLSKVISILAIISVLYLVVQFISRGKQIAQYFHPGTVVDVPTSYLQAPNRPTFDSKDCKCDEHLMKALMFGPLLQWDNRLINYSRRYLKAPSKLEYRLPDSEAVSQDWMFIDVLKDLLGKMFTPLTNFTQLAKTKAKIEQIENRFFVETHMRFFTNNTFLSNTLILEKDYSWNGLIFEPDPLPLKYLFDRNRKAWIVFAAPSTTEYAQRILAVRNYEDSILNNLMNTVTLPLKFVQSIPIYTVLAALNVSTVDFLSIGRSSKEIEILKTIPYDKLKVKTISVEHTSDSNIFYTIRDFLETKNYIFVTSIVRNHLERSLFSHNSVFY